PRPALPVPGLCRSTWYRRDPPLPVVVPRRTHQHRQRHPAVLVAPHPGPPTPPDHHPTLPRPQARTVDVHRPRRPDTTDCSTTKPATTRPATTRTRPETSTPTAATTATRIGRAGSCLRDRAAAFGVESHAKARDVASMRCWRSLCEDRPGPRVGLARGHDGRLDRAARRTEHAGGRVAAPAGRRLAGDLRPGVRRPGALAADQQRRLRGRRARAAVHRSDCAPR